ncbi:conserved hypothetical protein [Xanthomonas citri pv. citri]|nr:conserved hypothetical protein [Xanthomonas citri pv. citri]CEH64356.1 conserved hypothetical protein [Xanthomonas citri pv. citri]CEH95027.1 conserved hypothetical protein [Xanthomonas citri pv. citri]CEJ23251.1 conserved hypothetical protein [Xanthomonas citri pv. citri]CEJ28067.1 conserved hypothetical protein [Xanthomonas citri pv. citri]
MNQSDDPLAAFDIAKAAITAREKQEGEQPSLPQQSLGKRIAPVLARWRAGVHLGPAVAYPYPPVDMETESDQGVESTDSPDDAPVDAAPGSKAPALANPPTTPPTAPAASKR